MTVSFSLGLNSFEHTNGSRHGISSNLLRVKFSVVAFLSSFVSTNDNLLPTKSLFPAICTNRLVDFSNSYRGAKSCAADDFDISVSAENGQVEVFDSFPHADSQHYNPFQMPYGESKNPSDGYYYAGACEFGPALSHAQFLPSQDNTDQSVSQHSSQLYGEGEMRFHGPDGYFNRAAGLGNFVSRDIASEHQSHFAINACGINANPTFTDFRPQSFNDSSSYGSSLGSFDSPLDDLLFSGPPLQTDVSYMHVTEQRKRKVPEHVFSEEMLEEPMPAKRFKHEPLEVMHAPTDVGPTVEVNSEFGSEAKGRFACKECNASFKVKSYLTRHMKKHTNSKAFVCPFFSNNINNDVGETNKCHTNGGFSRKDTYTTHMKALHFVYPPRTKSSQRNTSGGRCTGCFEFFDNNACWLKNHIEAYLCPGLQDHSPESARVKQENSD